MVVIPKAVAAEQHDRADRHSQLCVILVFPSPLPIPKSFHGPCLDAGSDERSEEVCGHSKADVLQPQ